MLCNRLGLCYTSATLLSAITASQKYNIGLRTGSVCMACGKVSQSYTVKVCRSSTDHRSPHIHYLALSAAYGRIFSSEFLASPSAASYRQAKCSLHLFLVMARLATIAKQSTVDIREVYCIQPASRISRRIHGVVLCGD